MELPPLPRVVFTALGEVPVHLVEQIRDADGKLTHDMGLANFHSRTITIRSDLAPAALWHTLAHETFHFVLWDAGIQLPHRTEEQLCDAYATHCFQEMVTRR